MIGAVVAWYAVVQVVSAAVLPLVVRLCGALPDRGYSLAKATGILLVGVIFWLGYSYGLLRNELGGAWLAVGLVAGGSYAVGHSALREAWREVRGAGNWRVVLAVEVLFLAGYVVWAAVRAYDPAADHTEQPMDLMFINSIWTSATYPPQDAWFAGYPISYYYLGYWLLATLARLAAQPPEIAYNVGQAAWFGLLLIGSFGVVTNMLAVGYDRRTAIAGLDATAVRRVPMISAASMAGGLLGALAVGVIGNLMIVLEWLYARGMDLTQVAAWVAVEGFPERATRSGQWFIGYDWWWWRSSRVIEDLNLLGEHVEVIDEFPMFSYVLGDNHPHVLAMPVVLVVVGLAFNLLLRAGQWQRGAAPAASWRRLQEMMPLGALGLAVYTAAVGALIFLNTWDFPPYWVLLVGAFAIGGWLDRERSGAWWQTGLVFGALLVGGTLLIYLPYFLTAQSQAGGIAPNLFNPTRLPQFLLMFGQFVPGLVVLLLLVKVPGPSSLRLPAGVAGVVLGLPVLFLVLAGLAANSERGAQWLAGMQLPEGASGFGSLMLARWSRQFWTFLLVGAGLSLVVTALIATVRREDAGHPLNLVRIFALLAAAIGLGLAYAPEFVFLVDNFGTRMNTVFKFYYQAWLLLALTSAFAVSAAWRAAARNSLAARVFSTIGVALMGVGLLFPAAAVYAKTGGFRAEMPTLDAIAYISPDEQAAVAWVRTHTAPQSRVLEGKGASYWATYNRISTMTGRPTLLGWDGHESQWRGQAYGQMAAGRPEALTLVYRDGTPEQIVATLAQWDIDYVYVGPTEIDQYGISEQRLRQLGETLDLVFEQGQARIYR